ncbi:hypothetical protein DPMN_060655 [Dreissena polymorpha]|uniref:Uncharacterized protein n=1 Tax=Dreissena polymorpha TaxID=45954 RepID=A0A9D4C691_DREPO|nr:hypothetical protein DPMN_060652 [Dreissena polymorpha]KAH3717859.1 hypothetical protein DPMN_060655 [Dreissena polymorpha]
MGLILWCPPSDQEVKVLILWCPPSDQEVMGLILWCPPSDQEVKGLILTVESFLRLFYRHQALVRVLVIRRSRV